MLKLLVGALLFVCCGYVGYGINAYYRRRSSLLTEILGYIDALEKGISFLQSPPLEITLSYVADRKSDAVKILSEYVELLKKGEFSKQDCLKAVNTKLLTGYEKNVFAEMLFSLGRSDLDTQLAELSKYRANLTPISESAKQNYKKYGALSFKLGILAGLAAMLLVA